MSGSAEGVLRPGLARSSSLLRLEMILNICQGKSVTVTITENKRRLYEPASVAESRSSGKPCELWFEDCL